MNEIPFVVVQTGIPVILTSGAGRAKTSLIEEFAKAFNRNFYPIYLNSRDREDVQGFPKYNPETDQIEYKLDPSLNIKEPAVIFFDELNTAPEHVRIVAQRIINEKYLGNRRLKDVWFIIAGNPPGVSAGAVNFDPALVNRCCMFQWDVPLEWWTNFMLVSGKDFILNRVSNKTSEIWRPKFPVLNKAEFEKNLEKYIPVMTTFINRNTAVVTDPDVSEPYGSIRSATNAVTAYCAVKSTKLSVPEKDAEMAALASCIGKKHASAFLQFVTSLDLPDPIDILEGRKPLPTRHDLVHVTIVSLAARAKDSVMMNKVLSFYDSIYKKYADIIYFGLLSLKEQIVHCNIPVNKLNIPESLKNDLLRR